IGRTLRGAGGSARRGSGHAGGRIAAFGGHGSGIGLEGTLAMAGSPPRIPGSTLSRTLDRLSGGRRTAAKAVEAMEAVEASVRARERAIHHAPTAAVDHSAGGAESPTQSTAQGPMRTATQQLGVRRRGEGKH